MINPYGGFLIKFLFNEIFKVYRMIEIFSQLRFNNEYMKEDDDEETPWKIIIKLKYHFYIEYNTTWLERIIIILL